MIQTGVEASKHLYPERTEDLVTLLSGDFGIGPGEDDPGF